MLEKTCVKVMFDYSLLSQDWDSAFFKKKILPKRGETPGEESVVWIYRVNWACHHAMIFFFAPFLKKLQ